MADLNDSQKEKGKVRMRNLHPDLQKLINGATQSGTIDMQDLSQNLQNRIRNKSGDSGSGGGSYDLTEVMEELGRLNYNKADKSALKQYFDKTADHLTLDMLDSSIATKINNAAVQSDLLQYRPVSRDITYNDLDSDLKKKINNAELNGGGGSGGSNVSDETLAEIQRRLSQHDTGIAGNASSIESINERLNGMSELSALISLPDQVSKNTANITKVTNQLDDFLGTNDPENKEIGKIGRTRLTTGVLKQLDEGTDAQSKATALTARVLEAEGNITSLTARIVATEELADNVKKQSDDNKTKITKAQDDLANIVNGVDAKINDMNIDAVLAKTANTIEQGKIQKRHLADDITNDLKKAEEFETKLAQVTESIQKSNEIPGIASQFAYKGSKGTTTKAILNLFPIYDGNQDLDALENKSGYVGVKSSSSAKIYTFNPNLDHEVTKVIVPAPTENPETPADTEPESPDNAEPDTENTENTGTETTDTENAESENAEPVEQPEEPATETITVKGTWVEIDGGLSNELLNFTFILDTAHNKLYYVNDGSLADVDVNRPQIKDVTIAPDKFETFSQLDAASHIINILVKDSDTTSRSYGMYVNGEAFCTIAYAETEARIFNDTDDTLDVRIIYN